MKTNNNYSYSWSELREKREKLPYRVSTFVAISREMTPDRIKQIIKKHLPQGNMLWGVTGDEYVAGFEGQPQFRLLKRSELEEWVAKVNASSPNKLILLEYAQDQTERVLSKIKAKNYVFVRGSWKYAFHRLPVYHKLVSKDRHFEFISPFVGEDEAKSYLAFGKMLLEPKTLDRLKTIEDFMSGTWLVAKASFDHSFQVGAILAENTGPGEYEYVSHAHNQVVPYETYAMHHGFLREENLSPPKDLNHYDAIHAETAALISAKDSKGTTLFINVLPCPTCAKAVVFSGVSEVFYGLDHSDGYAVKLFKDAGIKTQKVEL